MSVENLTTRINQARDGHRRAAEMLSEARSTREDDFDWNDGRDVGEFIGGIAGRIAGRQLGLRVGVLVGAAIGSLITPVAGTVVGAIAGGTIGGIILGEIGEEVGSAIGGEVGEEIEDANRNDQNPVNITGDAAYQHERDQAELYAQRQGGGQVHLDGQGARGIDGAYYSDPNANPESTSPDHYISLKDKSNVTSEINVFREIRRNASQVSAAGYAGQTEIHVIVPFESEQMRNFIRENESNILPSEGVFQRILLDCADGELVEIDAFGNLSER